MPYNSNMTFSVFIIKYKNYCIPDAINCFICFVKRQYKDRDCTETVEKKLLEPEYT